MTDAEPEDIVTTVRDGVTVEKSFEPDDFPVPAIAFAIRSERDTVVSVRLVDTVPDDVAPENIGFHPKYGAEFWDVEDGRIVFQRDLAPGESYTTVYGLRGGEADTAAKFMGEPTLESVEPSLSEDESEVDSALDVAKIDELTNSGGETTGLAVSEESESVDGPSTVNEVSEEPKVLEVDDGTAADESLGEPDSSGEAAGADDLDSEEAPETEERSAGTEPVDELLGQSENSDTSTETEGPEPTEIHERSGDTAATSNGHESLVSGLAAEIREGNVDDDDLMTLRDALGLDFASASVEARIEHLQSEVSDLEAYTDALEAFLDEEGDAQTLIAEARDGHEEVSDRLADLETRLSEAQSELEERIESIDERVEETIDERIDTELASIRSDLEATEGRLETERDARDEMESDLERLSDELAEVAEMRDRLANALGGLGGGASAGDSAGGDEDVESSDGNDGEAIAEESDVDGAGGSDLAADSDGAGEAVDDEEIDDNGAADPDDE